MDILEMNARRTINGFPASHSAASVGPGDTSAEPKDTP